MELTPDAARLIVGSLDRLGTPGGGLRICRSGANPAKLSTDLVPAPLPDDTVVEKSGARVFVARDVSEVLASTVLDVKDHDGAYRLVLR